MTQTPGTVEDRLTVTFAALADPIRRAILARLASGEATVGDLAAPFEVSLQAVSKHLKVLERAGLITRGRNAQYRPCRFEAEPLQAAGDWIGRHRQIWEERFDGLERHLRTLQQSPPPPETLPPLGEPPDGPPDQPLPTKETGL